MGGRQHRQSLLSHSCLIKKIDAPPGRPLSPPKFMESQTGAIVAPENTCPTGRIRPHALTLCTDTGPPAPRSLQAPSGGGGGSSPSRLWVSGQGGAHGGRFPAGSPSPAGSAPARWSLGRWGMGYVEDSQALRGQALPAAAMPAGDRGGRYREAVLRALGSPSPSWQAHQDQGRPPQLPGRPGQGGLL